MGRERGKVSERERETMLPPSVTCTAKVTGRQSGRAIKVLQPAAGSHKIDPKNR